MRKRIITPPAETIRSREEGWLDVERGRPFLRSPRKTKDFPVEAVFSSGGTRGWRAAESGAQRARLVFDQPLRLKRIRLVFEEEESDRTQEFVLPGHAAGSSFRETLLQQWNFSPPDTTREVEQYQLDLTGVTLLELTIVPSVNGGTARASLRSSACPKRPRVFRKGKR